MPIRQLQKCLACVKQNVIVRLKLTYKICLMLAGYIFSDLVPNHQILVIINFEQVYY